MTVIVYLARSLSKEPCGAASIVGMPGGDAAVFRMGLLLLQRGLPPGVVWDNDRLRARPKAVSKQRHVCVATETDLYNLPDSAAECEIRMSAFLSVLFFFSCTQRACHRCLRKRGEFAKVSDSLNAGRLQTNNVVHSANLRTF